MVKGKDIQIDHGGFTRIHYAILDKLAVTHLTTYEYACLMFLFRHTYGFQKKEDSISLAQWANGTRIERRNLAKTLAGLVNKKVIYRKGGDTGRGHTAVWGFNKYVEQWQVKERVCVDTPFNDKEKASTDTPFNAEKASVHTPFFSTEKVCVDTPEKVCVDTPTKESIKKERGEHAPAILIYHEVFEVYPNARQQRVIVDQVKDLTLWQRACHSWAMRGHKATNVGGILDWYHYPERMDYINGNGPHKRDSGATDVSWQELFELSKAPDYD